MARRGPRKALWNQNRKPGPTKHSEKIIIQVLERSPKTFGELVGETGLAKITVAEELAKLEERGRIERKIEPPPLGKGRHRIVICLAEKELAPRERMLRHLENIITAQKIDTELGRKLLTDNIVHAILEIASLWWNSAEEKFEPSSCLSLELDEAVLIAALARYHFDVRAVWRMIEEEVPFDDPDDPIQRFFIEKSKEPEKLFEQFCKSHRRNPAGVFPALKVARKWKIEKELNTLLDWIGPHVFLRYGREGEPIDISDVMKFVVAPNFIAAAFKLAWKKYISFCVIPAWSSALKKYRKKGR